MSFDRERGEPLNEWEMELCLAHSFDYWKRTGKDLLWDKSTVEDENGGATILLNAISVADLDKNPYRKETNESIPD